MLISMCHGIFRYLPKTWTVVVLALFSGGSLVAPQAAQAGRAAGCESAFRGSPETAPGSRAVELGEQAKSAIVDELTQTRTARNSSMLTSGIFEHRNLSGETRRFLTELAERSLAIELMARKPSPHTFALKLVELAFSHPGGVLELASIDPFARTNVVLGLGTYVRLFEPDAHSADQLVGFAREASQRSLRGQAAELAEVRVRLAQLASFHALTIGDVFTLMSRAANALRALRIYDSSAELLIEAVAYHLETRRSFSAIAEDVQTFSTIDSEYLRRPNRLFWALRVASHRGVSNAIASILIESLRAQMYTIDRQTKDPFIGKSAENSLFLLLATTAMSPTQIISDARAVLAMEKQEQRLGVTTTAVDRSIGILHRTALDATNYSNATKLQIAQTMAGHRTVPD